MYRIDGQYLRFSGVNNPAQNDPASVTEPGAGFINMALNDPDAEAWSAWRSTTVSRMADGGAAADPDVDAGP